MNTAKVYVAELANSLTKITMIDFFKEIHSRCYPDQDISFMEMFLDLIDQEGQFVVSGTKLHEYGIMTSTRSDKILQKLDALGMENGVDFNLPDVRAQVENGIKYSKQYMLTPEAFKLCLMRAQRRPNQTIDPIIYSKYYLLLEKIHKLYTDYERQYSERLMAQKDDKLDKLFDEMKLQSNEMKQQSNQISDQDAKINQLLAFGNKIVGQNNKLQLTVDMTREELSESLDYLVDKSYHSTIDPVDTSKITHFAALAPKHDSHYGKTILVRGQTKRVKTVIQKHSETHYPIIDMTYNANAINLIVNAKKSHDEKVRLYVIRYNIPIKARNQKLKDEIIAHNKLLKQLRKSKTETNLIERSYSSEKKELLNISEINRLIKFNTISIWYEPNKHFSYQDVISTILDMNDDTQKSPIAPEPLPDPDTDESESDSA